MRALLVSIAVVGCHSAGPAPSTAAMPTLNPDPPLAPVALEPLAPVPTSAPSGEPIAITFVPPQVGSSRVRSLSMIKVRDDESGRDRKKLSEVVKDTYAIREQFVAVDGERVLTVKAIVDDAHQAITLDGKPREPMQLLYGTYVVDIGGGKLSHFRYAAKREDGSAVSSHDEEELGFLFGEDRGEQSTLVRVLRKHPVRVGESIVLTAEEQQTYAAGRDMPATLRLTLLEVADGNGVYQIDATGTETTGKTTTEHTIQHRIIIKLATGALLEMTTKSRWAQRAPGSKTTIRSDTKLNLAY